MRPGCRLAWCQALLTESRDVAGQLATDPRVGFFSFIGSAAVGWTLRARLAPGTRCALEHGGAAPVIIAADAELAATVPALVKGGFYHAGPSLCVGAAHFRPALAGGRAGARTGHIVPGACAWATRCSPRPRSGR